MTGVAHEINANEMFTFTRRIYIHFLKILQEMHEISITTTTTEKKSPKHVLE